MGPVIGCTVIGFTGGNTPIGWTTPIGMIGPRHCTFASITALCASTRPVPVARSGPTVATFPPAGPPGTVLQCPVVTSRAVLFMMFLTCAGVSEGQACLIRAATPASCGAAADVPLKAAHPSLLVVSSPFG